MFFLIIQRIQIYARLIYYMDIYRRYLTYSFLIRFSFGGLYLAQHVNLVFTDISCENHE